LSRPVVSGTRGKPQSGTWFEVADGRQPIRVSDGAPAAGIAVRLIRNRGQRVALFDGPLTLATGASGGRVGARPLVVVGDLLKGHVECGANRRTVGAEQGELLGDAGDDGDEGPRRSPLEADPGRARRGGGVVVERLVDLRQLPDFGGVLRANVARAVGAGVRVEEQLHGERGWLAAAVLLPWHVRAGVAASTTTRLRCAPVVLLGHRVFLGVEHALDDFAAAVDVDDLGLWQGQSSGSAGACF